KVISMVGSMQNLVNEVLQAAVGNHFRNTLQGLEAVRFIETRDQVQAAALEAISRYLAAYELETRGVYIQDVTFPQELVAVLTRREIANREKGTRRRSKDLAPRQRALWASPTRCPRAMSTSCPRCS